MNDSHVIYERYRAGVEAYSDTCAAAPERWHRPDVAEFTELYRLLLPHAESGDVNCQYALATIHWLGLCRETEEQFSAGRSAALQAATRWWIAAAMQGFWPALDNLATCGVGEEAKRASEAWCNLEKERPDFNRLLAWHARLWPGICSRVEQTILRASYH
jgi:hypothetical protein